MGIKISELPDELSSFSLSLVRGNGAAEITRAAQPGFDAWQPEALHFVTADSALPAQPPYAGCSVVLVGAETARAELDACKNINLLELQNAGQLDALLRALDELFADEVFICGATTRICETLLRRHTPQAVLDAANAALDMPMVIADFTHTIIANTCPPEIYGEEDWDSYIAHGVIPEFMGEDGSQLLETVCETPAGTLRLTYTPKTGNYNLISDMIYEGDSIGRISALLPRGKPTRREKRILAVTHEVLSMLIGSNPEAGFVRGDMMDTFLIKLVEGGASAEKYLMSQDKRPDYPHEGCFRVMVMDLETHRPFKQALRNIISYLELICPNTISAVVGKTLVMLTNYTNRKNYNTRNETELDSFIREFRMHCGVSREFENMRHFTQAYTEAVAAMEISHYTTHQDPDSPVYRLTMYDETESIIEANELYHRGEDLLLRCHPHVLKLRDYDEQFGSSYYETLYVYLSCAMKTQLAAEKLCLHRNSLEYRLRKIKAITGLNWDNGDLMMRLLRSFIYLEFMRIAEGRERFLRDISTTPRHV